MIEQLKQAWERLRSFKGFTTWLWIVILFVVLAIGLLMNDPLPPAGGELGGGMFGSTGLALSVFFRWIALIGFIYLAFTFFRKWQTRKTGPEQRRITVGERFYISPKQSLMLVKADGREFLIGATDGSIQMLAEIDEMKGEEALPDYSSTKFENILAEKTSGKKSGKDE